MLDAGTIIEGKYKVERLIGKGGMGAVYEGTNLRLRRRVAIKVMHASIARERDAVARFEREAQAAARIGSSHIVDVFDLGDLPAGERFMVMEYLEGETLTARLKRERPMRPHDIARIALQLLEGLAKVHDAGIVHRDLKPGNVFVARGSDGSDFVKILDFGVCKMSSRDRDRIRDVDITTGVGDVLGTPAYMSPEQLEHGPHKVDARSDLYSVGVLLYRAASGVLPFSGSNVIELVVNMRSGKGHALVDVAPWVDPGFAELVQHAIEWDREARYQTADEFRSDLTRWIGASGRIDQLLTDFLVSAGDVTPTATLESRVIPVVAPPPRAPTESIPIIIDEVDGGGSRPDEVEVDIEIEIEPPPSSSAVAPRSSSKLPIVRPPPKKPKKPTTAASSFLGNEEPTTQKKAAAERTERTESTRIGAHGMPILSDDEELIETRQTRAPTIKGRRGPTTNKK